MLRTFQVNVGTYLYLDRDILPTAKVSELCEAVQAVSGEDASSQVLLASDGRQMNPSETIGAYSITESQPVYVFYRSHLMSPEPPTSPSPLPQRGSLQQQLELIRLKPSPGLFQKQVALAKRLSEHSARVGRACGQLAEEYQLQYSGWRTVLSNCSSIIRTYQKHRTLFSKSVEGFNQAMPRFSKLLQEFPTHVKLLQQLPVPTALQSEDSPTSLYDWISTHDEKNNLQDLGAECQRSLSKVDSDRISSTLESSEHILADAEPLLAQEDAYNERIAKLQSLAKDAVAKVDTQLGFAQSIQSTSERALRSGDAGTIADLVLSHHKSLQLMANYLQELEVSGKEIEKWKASLTRHIHTKLKDVTLLQKRVADSNNQLVMLHEYVKLARKRFEILEQVCSAPDVLVKVLSEVERRRLYNSSLEKKTGEVSQLLKKARGEEKLQRKAFFERHGQHFILTLFPELQERVPDITVHLPKSLLKSLLCTDKDLDSIIQRLPENLRSSATSTSDLTCSSIKILSTPLAISGTEQQAATNAGVDSADSALFSNSISAKVASVDIETQTEEIIDETKIALQQALLQLESVTQEMLMGKEQHATDEEQLAKLLREECEKNAQRLSQIELLKEDSAHLKQLVEEQQVAITEKETELKLAKSTLESELRASEQVKLELEETKTQYTAHLQQQEERFQSEKDHLERSIEQSVAQLNNLQSEMATSERNFKEQAEQLTTELERSRHENDVLIRQANQVQVHEKEQEIARLNRELNNANSKLKNTTEGFQEERHKLQTALDEIQAEFQHFKENTEAEEKQHDTRYQQAQKAINNLKAQLEKAQVQVRNSESRVNDIQGKLVALQGSAASSNNTLQERLQESERLKSEVETQAKDCTDKLNSQEKKLSESEKEKMEARKQVTEASDKLSSMEKRLSECQTERKEAEKQAKEATGKVDSLKEMVSECKKGREKAEKQSKEATDKLSSLEKKLCEEKKQAEKQLKEATDKINAFEKKVAECEKERKEALKHAEEAEKKLSSAKEKLMKLEDDLKQAEQKQLKCSEELRTAQGKAHDKIKQLQEKCDSDMKHAMEVERELKELKRDMGLSPPTSLEVGETAVKQAKPQPVPSKGAVVMSVSIGTLQVGDSAIFMNDQYGNYLALTLDEKTYYLNQSSVSQLEDLAAKRVNFPRKILCGRLTSKVLVEVRKESNRLRVPVGERLYKIDAEPCTS